MRGRGRLLGACTAAGAVVLLTIAPAQAQTPPPPDTPPTPAPELTNGWERAEYTHPEDGTPPAGSTVSNATVTFTGVVRHATRQQPTVNLGASPPQGAPTACIPEANSAVVTAAGGGNFAFRGALTFPCNLTYAVTATASVPPPPIGPRPPSQRIPISISTAAPGPPVTGLAVSKGDGRTVELRWVPPAPPPDGLLGYLVERSVNGGEFSQLTVIDDPATESYTDKDVPTSGGKLAYRVSTLRNAPGGPVTSQAADGDGAVTFEAVPGSSSTTSPGGTSQPTVGSATAGRRIGGSLDLPGLSSPNTSQGRRSTTSTTVDTGFLETLPFEDREPGDDEPALPGDGFASVTFEEGGAGLLVPAAVALLLLVWAAHLRYLNRLAKA